MEGYSNHLEFFNDFIYQNFFATIINDRFINTIQLLYSKEASDSEQLCKIHTLYNTIYSM